MDDTAREKFEELEEALKVESERVSELVSRVQWLEGVVDKVAETTALQTVILDVPRGEAYWLRNEWEQLRNKLTELNNAFVEVVKKKRAERKGRV
jgi:hypothetical protein